ncbi:hypothetical protein ES332_D01G188400v1 [Gossypium tomentosum]|uniref:Copia protein n=1 Tax=Gossypium tomentosum TaxID=34277 RepID=A0A5D2MB27_GOSTO|nr:hypothetical protein ES332_D01G188400v1 [Gossypium tomentosum]
MATQECLWLKRLIREMMSTLNHPIQIYCLSESAINIARNLVFHACTKHIETHYCFVQEKVLTHDIELLKIRTKKQVADIFTKALAKAKFESFCEVLGVINSKFPLRGSVKF